MSGAPSKPIDLVALVRTRSIDYVQRLPAAKRDRLAAWAGAPASGKGAGAVEACVTAAMSGEGTKRILTAIDRDAREAFLYFYVGADALPEYALEEQLRDHFGWLKARARAAVEALLEAGLIARRDTHTADVESIPALRIGLGHSLMVWLAGADADAPPAIPFHRRLALLVAHAHADPVTFTAQRAITVRWMDRALGVFAATRTPQRVLGACVDFLGRAGALRQDPSDATGRTVRPAPGWAQVCATEPSDLALAFAELDHTARWGAPLVTLALLERARLAGEERPTLMRLSELGKAWGQERHREYPPFSPEQISIPGIASAVRLLKEIGLVSAERIEGFVRVARTAPPAIAARPFRCTVLPTFEIWVAEDTDPAGTADLGRIAELTSTDRVARFTLTQKAVERAAREPGGALAAIARLAAAAEHGLPDNVRTTLEGWARRAKLIRPYLGATVVAETDEQAAFLRDKPGVRGELARGVFHVEASWLPELLDAAEKAGHLLAPTVRDERTDGRRTYGGALNLGQRAQEVRAQVARWATAEKQKPPAPSKRPPDAPRGAGPAFDDRETTEPEPFSLAELRREWPEVVAAVRGYPSLLWLAQRLSAEELDDILENAEDLDEVRAGLFRLASALDRLEPGPQGAPRSPALAGSAPSGPAAVAPEASDPWVTPNPGALVRLLGDAALRKLTIDIVYVNGAGVRSERRIVPLQVLTAGRTEWLDARLLADGSTARFDVERIAAVRLARE